MEMLASKCCSADHALTTDALHLMRSMRNRWGLLLLPPVPLAGESFGASAAPPCRTRPLAGVPGSEPPPALSMDHRRPLCEAVFQVC